MKQRVNYTAGSRCENCEGTAECDITLRTVTCWMYSGIFIPLFYKDVDRTAVFYSEIPTAGQPAKRLEARSVGHTGGN